MQARLISTSVLNDQGIRVILENRKLLAIRTADNQTAFEGTGRDRLYYLNQPAEKALTAQATTGNLTVQPTDDRKAPTETQRELWHKRFGHTSYKTIDSLPNDIIGVKLQKIPPGSQPAGSTACEYCLAGRMKESFRSKTDNQFETKLRRLHADLSGIKETSIQGYHYFLIVIDDATRATWIRFLRTKSAAEVVPQFKQLKTELELEANTKVIFIRYDNRKGEFGAEFQSYLQEEGIQIEPCPAYKHSMNGVAERIIGLIDKLVRSILYQAKASHRLWDYTTEHAVWLRNRLPTTALPYSANTTAKTPFESYYGIKPDVSNLRIFGYAAYPLNSIGRMPGKYVSRTQGERIFVGLRGNRI